MHRLLVAAAATAAASAFLATPPAQAVGRLVDVGIVDRDTGETLRPIRHGGEWWVVGRPGARYAVTLANRQGRRTLDVVSVDGVNAISGDTAGWDQTGYVLDPYQRYQVTGWRKSSEQVAAFEFATKSDSYAARTGRPDHVGVIGVAIFDERPPLRPTARDDGAVGRERRDPPPVPVPAPSASDATRGPAPAAPSLRIDGDARASGSLAEAKAAPAARAAEPLGTGHGAIEASVVRDVAFERARPTPDEIVVIRYDRLENLIARGIVPAEAPLAAADPFPARRYVPDPPGGR